MSRERIGDSSFIFVGPFTVELKTIEMAARSLFLFIMRRLEHNHPALMHHDQACFVMWCGGCGVLCGVRHLGLAIGDDECH